MFFDFIQWARKKNILSFGKIGFSRSDKIKNALKKCIRIWSFEKENLFCTPISIKWKSFFIIFLNFYFTYKFCKRYLYLDNRYICSIFATIYMQLYIVHLYKHKFIHNFKHNFTILRKMILNIFSRCVSDSARSWYQNIKLKICNLNI